MGNKRTIYLTVFKLSYNVSSLCNMAEMKYKVENKLQLMLRQVRTTANDNI